MKSYIIGIAGELNSGKDTVASMINYIVAVGTTKAKYENWLTNKVKYDNTFGDRITHFADPMKDCLSIMYNIPRGYFDDRKYKDELWYCIEEKRFITEKDAEKSSYLRVYIDNIQGMINPSLGYILNIFAAQKLVVIKLRTLMQYFGTEIVRNNMGKDLWVNAAISRAADIAERRRICIIPDVRFTNERAAIRNNSLYGGDIYIKRELGANTTHASEIIDFDCKYTINNSGTKMQLFYDVINTVSSILKN